MGGPGKSSSRAKTIAQKNNKKNGGSELTAEEKDMMISYTEGASFFVNRYLALGIEHPHPEVYTVLDSAINKGEIPQGTKLYRGSNPVVLGIQKNIIDMTDDEVKQLIGKTITNKAYISTSKSKEVAKNYAGGFITPKILAKDGTEIPPSIDPKGNVHMIITAKNNTKGFDATKYSFFYDKQEVILPRGSQFKITNAKRESNNLTVYIDY